MAATGYGAGSTGMGGQPQGQGMRRYHEIRLQSAQQSAHLTHRPARRTRSGGPQQPWTVGCPVHRAPEGRGVDDRRAVGLLDDATPREQGCSPAKALTTRARTTRRGSAAPLVSQGMGHRVVTRTGFGGQDHHNGGPPVAAPLQRHGRL